MIDAHAITDGIFAPPQAALEWKGMAEREGFEPPVPVKVRLISSQVH